MLDRDLVLDAIEDAQRILAAHIEPGSHRSPETTITMLVCLLDRHEVVAAVKRLRAGYGLRVVKWSRSVPIMALRLKRTEMAIRGRLSVLKLSLKQGRLVGPRT